MSDAGGLSRSGSCTLRSRRIDEAVPRARTLDVTALRLAMTDLRDTYGSRYGRGAIPACGTGRNRRRLVAELPRLPSDDLAAYERVAELVADFDALQREALLANPLLDFDRLLLIRRQPHGDPRRPNDTGYGMGEYLGLPRQSSKCNSGHRRAVRLGQRDRRAPAGAAGRAS